MISVNTDEAILLRLLVAFFGKDRVVPHMSVLAVCGGTLPERLAADSNGAVFTEWARRSKCLFTVVDAQDQPRLVVDFVPDFDNAVDVERLEHQRFLRPLLEAAGVNFIAVTRGEFSDMTRPGSDFGLVELLKSHYDIAE